MDHQDDLFPELHQRKLIQFAAAWVSQYPGIRQITLTTPTDPNLPSRFLVSFFPEDTGAQESLSASILSLDNLTRSFRSLIGGRSFISVYRTAPDELFRDDWDFEVLPPDSQWAGNGWILFPHSEEGQKADELEGIVRNLRVWIESDEEVGFQIPGHQQHCFRHDVFGFRGPNTAQWRALQNCLALEGVFDLEDIRPGKSHNSNRMLLSDQINRGFLQVMQFLFRERVPPKFKIYERIHKGKYAFKFRVISSDTAAIPLKSSDDYLKSLESLKLKWIKARQEKNIEAIEFFNEKFEKVSKEAVSTGKLDQNKIKLILKPAE